MQVLASINSDPSHDMGAYDMMLSDGEPGEVELCLSKKIGSESDAICQDRRFQLQTSCCSVAADDRGIILACDATVILLRFKEPHDLTEACSFLTSRISSKLVLADESHYSLSLIPLTPEMPHEVNAPRCHEAHRRKSTLPFTQASLQIRGQNWPQQCKAGLASKVADRIAEDGLDPEEFGLVRFSDV